MAENLTGRVSWTGACLDRIARVPRRVLPRVSETLRQTQLWSKSSLTRMTDALDPLSRARQILTKLQYTPRQRKISYPITILTVLAPRPRCKVERHFALRIEHSCNNGHGGMK